MHMAGIPLDKNGQNTYLIICNIISLTVLNDWYLFYVKVLFIIHVIHLDSFGMNACVYYLYDAFEFQ